MSLIPGVYLSLMGGGLSSLGADGAAAPAGLLQGIATDGTMAMMILLAMVSA